MEFRPGLSATLLAVCSSAAAGTYEAPTDVRKDVRARFTTKPGAKKARDGVRISFSVSAPTDVEVAVLDSRGKVVRHLAAGLLGKNAPAPFRKNSLRQEILWDRRDDAGRPALSERSESKGPFRVRVRLGVRPRLEKHVGWDGNNLRAATLSGLAVGKGGEVYVLLADSWGRSEVRVLDKTGEYLRTIMPYPANAPEERLKSIGRLEIEGVRLPVVFSGFGGNLHPLTAGFTRKRQNMVFSPEGHLLMASAVGTLANHRPPRHLLALHPEGGAPEGVSFVGPRIRKPGGFMGGAGERDCMSFDSLAASPDGDWIYLTTWIDGYAFKKQRRHGVFRLKWTEEKLGEPFLGRKEPGADDEHFNDPQGLAVDGKGRIYVCDRGNNRVMVFSGGGKLLGKFAVENPQQIAVHPRSGEMYIVSRKPGRSYRHPGTKLFKFSAWGKENPRELIRLEQQKRVIELMALAPAPAASPPKLWAVFYMGYGKPNELVPIVDRGGRLEIGESVCRREGLSYPKYLAADPERNRVLFVQHGDRKGTLGALELTTGKITRLPVRSSDVALDRQGNIYVMHGVRDKGSIARYDPDGRPLPFPGTGSHEIKIGYYRPNGYSGLCVGADGQVYVFRVNNAAYGGVADYDGVEGCVDSYGPDGKLRKRGLVNGLGHGDCGLAVDAAGNLYVGVNVKPKDRPFPKAFTGKLPAQGWVWWHRGRREVPWRYPYCNHYLYHWGSVFKFGPEGGKIYGLAYDLTAKRSKPKKISTPSPLVLSKNAPAGAASYYSGYLKKEVRVEGARWRYPGFGVIPASDVGWGDPSCTCQTSHLAADGYGRVFVPNVFRFSVEMLDTGGNHVARIGSYGNADSAGPKSKIPEPEIAFAWPVFVSVAGGKLYVSDSVNRRITVVRFEYAGAAETAVP